MKRWIVLASILTIVFAMIMIVSQNGILQAALPDTFDMPALRLIASAIAPLFAFFRYFRDSRDRVFSLVSLGCGLLIVIGGIALYAFDLREGLFSILDTATVVVFVGWVVYYGLRVIKEARRKRR